MGEMPNQSDAQLLREYAAHGDEPAFGEIVARHTGLVYSAALRQSGSPERAREIAQSVFTDLARKARTLAGSLTADASLAGWLYRGTRYAALNSLRDERRRQAHERLVMENFNPSSEASPDWERVAPVLDEAMAELNDADREAVLLRFFKNQDFHAVGLALGVSDDAVAKTSAAMGKYLFPTAKMFRALRKIIFPVAKNNSPSAPIFTAVGKNILAEAKMFGAMAKYFFPTVKTCLAMGKYIFPLP